MDILINKKKEVVNFLRRILRRHSIHNLQKRKGLWNELKEYKSQTNSTGCSWIDLWTLYKIVRQKKFKEILELGPGVSTLVMSYALMENEKEGHFGRITSLEENEYYYKKEVELHPAYLKKYVNFFLCPKVEDKFYFFRGVKYKDKPFRHYDFVFIDGPTLESPIDNVMTFDFDFIEVVMQSERPVLGLVDYRLTTSFVFQAVFGKDKVKFDGIRELCFVGPVSKADLLDLSLDGLTKTFNQSIKIFGNTEIKLK